jgi:hypothetical protein
VADARNTSKPDGGVFNGQGSDQEQQAVHLDFRWPSAWTQLAAHLELATAADTEVRDWLRHFQKN